jgi:hypothetical protein
MFAMLFSASLFGAISFTKTPDVRIVCPAEGLGGRDFGQRHDNRRRRRLRAGRLTAIKAQGSGQVCPRPALTTRQLEIARLIAEGLSPS